MTPIHTGLAEGSYAIFEASRSVYDGLPGINQSLLKEMERSPAHFRYKQTAPPKPPSKAMILGCLVEHFALGTEFAYAVSPFEDFKKTEAKLWRDDKIAKGIPIVDQELIDKAHAMAGRVNANEWFKAIRAKSRTNIALVAVHKPTGVLMKALVDLASDEDLALVDLKTCRDASVSGFARQILDFGYHYQAASYQWLWNSIFGESRTFCFQCVESEEPYETSSQVMHEKDLVSAWAQYEKWLAKYKECKDSGVYPGYGSELKWVSLPPWAFKTPEA